MMQKIQLVDYHTHTPLCHHAIGKPEEYVQAAINANLLEYGISDHAPTEFEPFDEWRMNQADIPDYLDWISRAEIYAGNQITIRKGLECDWFMDGKNWIDELNQITDWDYLIGSVHYIQTPQELLSVQSTTLWDFDNPKWQESWGNMDVDQLWELYFATYLDMIEHGGFDICAHPDLIKKFGYKPQRDTSYYFAPIIEALKDTNTCFEINTAGLYKPCQEQYPQMNFIELAAQAEVPVILSSDSHAPTEVARDFDKVLSLIHQAGFKHTSRFEKRQRYQLAIN